MNSSGSISRKTISTAANNSMSTQFYGDGLPRPLLTRKQVASLLAVTTKTIDKYCNDGKLVYVRIPAGKRFDPADLETFITARKSNHRTEA